MSHLDSIYPSSISATSLESALSIETAQQLKKNTLMELLFFNCICIQLLSMDSTYNASQHQNVAQSLR